MTRTELLTQTASIIASHVSHNSVSNAQLPGLIQNVFHTLNSLERNAPMPMPSTAPAESLPALTPPLVVAKTTPVPAVAIKDSVHPDYIVCLEDGRRLTMLKRHLATVFRMTPDEYRRRWGLKSNYPMVAPSYAQRRSELAKQNGLGRRHDDLRSATMTTPAVRRIPEGVSGNRKGA